MSSPTRCDPDIFSKGSRIMLASTGDVGGNHIFEAWVAKVREKSGQQVDWHYSGGVAQVLFLGDKLAVEEAISDFFPELPEQIRVLAWEGPPRYRNGVDTPPDIATI